VIVVDTSALIAILFDEPERAGFLTTIADADTRAISALTLYETRIVVRAKGGEVALADLDELLAEIQPEIMPFDAARMRAAEAAYARYGKGIHSSARLNLVDCAAYALAIELGAPLLFKGNDFAATDVLIAAA
jgi:ribonuclease VapC